MNPVSIPSHNYQALVPSYIPLGKPAAGLESPENKDQTLPPVEEANASEKERNQPNLKADAVSGEERDGEEKDRQPLVELIEEEQQQLRGEPAPEAVTADAQPPVTLAPGPLQIALQRAAALQSDHLKSAVDAHAAVDSFSATAGHTLAPGVLLDQRS